MWADHIITFPPKINQASPLFLMSIYCVFIIVFFSVVPEDYLTAWGFTMSEKDMEVDEDLPNFFEALKFSEVNKLIDENKHMQENYGFELYEYDFIEKLENIEWPEKSIQGTPWYAIMCNDNYVNDFAWMGPHVKDRDHYIKDDDKDP